MQKGKKKCVYIIKKKTIDPEEYHKYIHKINNSASQLIKQALKKLQLEAVGLFKLQLEILTNPCQNMEVRK